MSTSTTRLLSLLATMNETGRSMSLSEAAEATSLSPSHLQRIFTAAVGESPTRYQRRLRLELGAIELRSSDARILDIAIGAGFESHEAFTRAFADHFGVTPRIYRERSRPLDSQESSWPAGSGPCVGLYRMNHSPPPPSPSQNTTTEESPMTTPDVSRETIEETATIVVRRRVDKEEIAEALAECLPAAFGYAMEHGLTMTGPPFVRHHGQSAAFVEIEAGVPISEPADVDHEMLAAGTLPGGSAAVAIHVGPYETLGDTHAVIDRWMDANGVDPTGGPWEIYLTDPGEVPDPNDWQTKIVWPVA